MMDCLLDDGFQREDRNRLRGFCDALFLEYREDEFRYYFRMSKSTAELVVKEVERVAREREYRYVSPRDFPGGRPEVPIRDKVLIMLWYMAHSCTYRLVATFFGVSESTANHCVRAIIKLTVENLLPKIIKWPSEDEAAQISRMYEDLNGFPGVIGFLDGTHIQISKPFDRPQDYYNRKDFYSIQLQAVAREDLRFTDVYAGWPGKVHDARVFAASPLAENGARLCGQRHILADGAYPCMNWLLTPLKQPRHNEALTDAERSYNRVLSSMRVNVERAFGRLKGRFKRLRPLVQADIELMVDTILAACVLHNICIIAADDVDDLDFEDMPMDGDNAPQAEVNVANNLFAEDERVRGNIKRLSIIRIF